MHSCSGVYVSMTKPHSLGVFGDIGGMARGFKRPGKLQTLTS